MHDAKGRELKVGDFVMIPCRVKAIHASEDFCNVQLQSIATIPGTQPASHSDFGAINTQQVLRACERRRRFAVDIRRCCGHRSRQAAVKRPIQVYEVAVCFSNDATENRQRIAQALHLLMDAVGALSVSLYVLPEDAETMTYRAVTYVFA